MRVIVERAALLKSLTHVHRVVERRNTIPILSNVLIRAEGDRMTLRATDLDIEVTEAVPAMIERDGATTVAAHVLYDIVRKLPDGAEVALDASGDQSQMSLQAGRAQFNLQVLPETDFPDLTAGDFSHSFNLGAGIFKYVLDKTEFAISTEETRYYLNGIYLHRIEECVAAPVLRAVATDGHRLARIEIAAPEGTAGMPGMIVPRKAVQELQRLLDDPELEVGIEASDAKIRFTVGPVVLTSKLIDGTFPDYMRVIPSGNDKLLRVDTATFARAVDLVSTVSSERGRAVKLSIDSDRVVLSVNNPDSGSATEEVSADYAFDGLDIGFNARYLLDITSQLESENARFELNDPGSPTLIRNEQDESLLYVLMPMRV